MGRGRSSSGGGRGFSSSSSRGSSRSGGWGRGSRTTIIVGGNRYYGSGHHHTSSHSGRAVPIIIGVVFLLFAIPMIILGINGIRAENKYLTVQAEAIDNTYISGWYYTTYEYTIDNVEYTNMSKEGWEYPEQIGKIVTIYYLKDNPDYITEKSPNSDGTTTAVIIFGVVFGLAGTMSLVIGIKSLKSAKNNESTATFSPTNTTTPTSSSSDYIICRYCGTRHNKNVTSCPNCGAAKSWSDD